MPSFSFLPFEARRPEVSSDPLIRAHRLSPMWRYSLAVLVLWIVNPELRRLYDWRFGYASVEIISVFPIVALIPHLWSLSVGGGWTRLPRVLAIAAWCWLGAFGYGLILGIYNENSLAAIYSFATFVTPFGLGLWVAADPAPPTLALRRISRLLFGVTTFVSLYGILQFVILPEWDALWLKNVTSEGVDSFGLPKPFQVRVFSVLNAPGPLGSFLALAMLFAVPQLSLRQPLLLVQIPLWFLAFGLTLDRSGWGMFAAGLICYVVFCSQRLKLVVTLGIAIGLVGFVAFFGSAAVGSDILTTTIGDRIGTLTDLGADRSANARQDVYVNGFTEFMEAPYGRGLGVVGTSTKLGSAQTVVNFDSGVLARLIELGIPGAAMLAAGWYLLIAGGGLPERSHPSRDVAVMATGAALSLAILQLFGDVAGFPILFLWLFAALRVREVDDSKRETQVGALRLQP